MEHHEIPQAEKADAEKRKRFEEIFHGKPEAIFILSGDIIPRKKKGEETGEYKSPAYSEPDHSGSISGGKARVIAGAEAAEVFPEVLIVTNSYIRENEPTHAKVMAEELKRVGVSGERIILQENSFSTVTELIEMIKLVMARGWKKVAVITNNYHIPRVQEFMRRLDSIVPLEDNEFRAAWQAVKDMGTEIKFISAEDILPERSKRYEKIIGSVKESEPYKKRIGSEKKGVQDLQEGRYKFRGKSKKL